MANRLLKTFFQLSPFAQSLLNLNPHWKSQSTSQFQFTPDNNETFTQQKELSAFLLKSHSRNAFERTKSQSQRPPVEEGSVYKTVIIDFFVRIFSCLLRLLFFFRCTKKSSASLSFGCVDKPNVLALRKLHLSVITAGGDNSLVTRPSATVKEEKNFWTLFWDA